MKKRLLIFIAIVLIEDLRAQTPVVFCPPGAEWHYSFEILMPYTIYNEKIQYAGDSLLGNTSVKVLRHRNFYAGGNGGTATQLTLIKQNADTVFFRNRITQQSWQILYNFATPAGQSWTTIISDSVYDSLTGNNVLASEIYTVTVDSTKTVSINGFNLKRLFVRYLPDMSTTQITERFGPDKFMFNYTNLSDNSDPDGFDEYLCYQDSSFGSKQFTDKPCNYTDYVGIEEIQKYEGISLYPNPVKDRFNLDFEAGEPIGAEFNLTNTMGQSLISAGQLGQHQEIDVSSFPTGVYFLKIHNKSGQKVFKIIKVD